MADTIENTDTIPAPPSSPPLPNDSAARSPTGEILEPSQIAAAAAAKPEAQSDEPPPKPADDKTLEAKPPAAPEAYTEFKAPVGYTLDPKAIEAATPIFKELGLSQDQAQKLVEFHASQMIEAAKGPQATYETMRNDWKAAVAADTDLKAAVSGGKTGLDAVKLDIGRALNALGDAKLSQDFKDAINLTGVGDHPAFIKAMWKLSSFVTEGKHVEGQNPSIHGQRAPGSGEKPTGAKAMYPNLS